MRTRNGGFQRPWHEAPTPNREALTANVPKAVLALDQGTTSSRAVVFGHDGTILGMAQHEFPQHYPQPGWVEHDPEDIWATQLRAGREAIATSGLEAKQLAAIGIANQRETTLLWDSDSGAPRETPSCGSAGGRQSVATSSASPVGTRVYGRRPGSAWTRTSVRPSWSGC